MEEPLNEVTLLAEVPVDCFSAASRWVLLDLCGRAQIISNEAAQMVGVVARIGDDMADPLLPLDQCTRLRAIAPVPGSYQEPDRQSQSINGGMNFRRQTASGSPDGASFRPSF